jgi:hypothetical protein
MSDHEHLREQEPTNASGPPNQSERQALIKELSMELFGHENATEQEVSAHLRALSTQPKKAGDEDASFIQMSADILELRRMEESMNLLGPKNASWQQISAEWRRKKRGSTDCFA